MLSKLPKTNTKEANNQLQKKPPHKQEKQKNLQQ